MRPICDALARLCPICVQRLCSLFCAFQIVQQLILRADTVHHRLLGLGLWNEALTIANSPWRSTRLASFLYYVLRTMYNVPCTIHHVLCTMYSVPCTVYTVHSLIGLDFPKQFTGSVPAIPATIISKHSSVFVNTAPPPTAFIVDIRISMIPLAGRRPRVFPLASPLPGVQVGLLRASN